jgi:2-keto-3-deoxygluconate permease
MQLKRAIERIPGSMMTVPLLAGAALTTFAPHAAPFFGSFTNSLYNGALPTLAIFYVCIGDRCQPYLNAEGAIHAKNPYSR